MKKLSNEKFQLAKKFIKEQARPIDQALFSYVFEDENKEKVLEELKKFQNEDGGFGHAIEPDFRLQISSPMATTVGLQYARSVGATSREKIIEAAITYLLNSYNHQRQRWQALSKEVNEVPHAPWWSYNVETDACGVEETWANPSAEIVGYLHDHKSLVKESFLEEVTSLALEQLNHLPESIEMHDFLCYQRLVDSLHGEAEKKVKTRLRGSTRLTVTLNPAEWSGYSVRPLQIVHTPNSPFYDLLEHEVELNLQFEIDTIGEDGAWRPNWSWFGQYEEEWKKAEVEWAGYLTVSKLITLKNFDRIEL
ncbi:hypothetical protein GCM10008967_13430 [Bacillus carboniphilus]|uniref:Uncharacterized protein n=1 Tax=Bacillus carboniphilus TaxID=86663 RepID=A0ABP3FRN4_9BACI